MDNPSSGEVKLPPRTITSPKVFGAVLWRLAPAIVVGIGIVLAVDHQTSGFGAALIGVGLFVLLFSGTLALTFGFLRRRQESMTQALPAGSIYAGPATMVAPEAGIRSPIASTVVFADSGVTVTPKKPRSGLTAVRVPWSRVTHFELVPIPNKFRIGNLVLHLDDGTTKTFHVLNYGMLAEILGGHA